MDRPPHCPVAVRRAALRRGLAALALALAGLAALPPATAQEPQTPAPSPSDPPYWARPRQGPAPVCEAVPTTTPVTRGPSALATGLAVAGFMLTLFLVWRRLQKPVEESYSRAVIPAAVPPTPTPAPPLPADGLDPRLARLRPPKPAAEPVPVPTTPEEVALADMRTMTIELAQDEPSHESAGAQAFYAEIAASLVAALHKEPERQDLRRKLLEIYFAARQVNEFVSLAHEYLESNRGRPDQFWPDIGAMGAKLAPDHEMFEEFAPGRRYASRRVAQNRRFHERNVDPGRMYTAQQALVADFERLRADASFRSALQALLADSVRRPAPLAASPELSYIADGAQIFVKHEDRRRFHDDDLINAVGQILVAQRLGRTRVVTATRNGMHGHAVAAAAARLGMDCHIYVTERDLNRHYARMLSMRRLGANIRPIPAPPDEMPDPRRNALDAWLDDPAQCQYVSGLTAGPAPFPEMVREFLAVVGRETLEQMQQSTGAPPSAVVANVTDGHLGLGLLQGLLEERAIELHCVEEKPDPTPPPVAGEATPPEPQPRGTPTRREHRWLRDTRRVQYVQADEQETMRVIEQYHATGTTLYTQTARSLAYARSLARRRERKDTIVVLLTGQEGADFRSLGSDW
jgi:tryptophan synthase beta chain